MALHPCSAPKISLPFSQISTLLLSHQNPNFPEVLNFSSVSLFPKQNPQNLLQAISLLNCAVIGATAGASAGAFTYVCLLSIDAVKMKLQTAGAAQIYSYALDAAVKTFKSDGILGFYRSVSAAVIGSATSSAVYFGTCEFGRICKFGWISKGFGAANYRGDGNVASSAIMVPK